MTQLQVHKNTLHSLLFNPEKGTSIEDSIQDDISSIIVGNLANAPFLTNNILITSEHQQYLEYTLNNIRTSQMRLHPILIRLDQPRLEYVCDQIWRLFINAV